MSSVRVRFAPSPTGHFHIGSARTALFNWLYAKHTKGTFILRIEDTDPERNTKEALAVLIHGMRFLGLDWDEGPEMGGPYGPYFQSERSAIYKEYLEKLRSTGRTYEKEGAIWFQVSGEPQIIHDAVRGTVTRLEEKDFVIFRSNGNPVFHFVNVVDDIAMKITHVIRGEDHLSNASKHVELFKAFGAPLPTFAHIPLILKGTGPGKMSKRDEGALVDTYEQRSFLPAALVNYLCLLGWSPKEDREKLPIESMIELFELSAINKNNARFDEQKLAYLNMEYLRDLPLNMLTEKVYPILRLTGILDSDAQKDYLQKVLAISQEKLRSLEEAPDFLRYCFKEDYAIDPEAHKKCFQDAEALVRLQEVHRALENLADFSPQGLEAAFKALCAETGKSSGNYLLATRLAVSGKGFGPSFYPLLSLLGKERVLLRLKNFIQRA